MAHQISRHHTLWRLLFLVTVGMGVSTFLASVQLQRSWFNAAALTFVVDAPSKTTSHADPFSALSAAAQEKRRKERNRVFRYYPAEKRTQSVPSQVCGTAPEFNHFFDDQKSNRRSLNEEDKILNSLFSSAFQETGSSGTYVEVGAYNGRAESNTRFFDECLGWNGLLIEANPKIYKALVRNRPRDHRMSFSPTCTMAEEFNNKTLPFHGIDTTTAGVEGHAILHMGKEVLGKEVPCGSLTPILVEIFPEGHMDFFSLDMEGGEALVVENLDFNQLFIELFVVENNSKICGLECEVRDRVRKRLKEVGYTLYTNVIANSDLFIHPDSKYQLPAGYKTIPVEDYIANVAR